MKNDFSLGQNSIRLLYYRYKDSPYYHLAVISVIFTVCLILISQVVIPQIQSWFSINNEITATRSRIATLNQNINFMNNLNKNLTKQQAQLSTNALPFEKDFGAILVALNDASLRSGVSLEDFNFQVGNIASSSAQSTKGQKDISWVELTVSLTGNFDAISSFLQEMNHKLPLSEVVSVEGDTFATAVVLRFYQKQFPKIIFHDDQPLVPLSAKQSVFLEEISAWLPAEQESSSNPDIPSASESSQVVPLF